MWLRNLFLHRKSVQKLCQRTFINPKVTKERLLSEYRRATAYVNGKALVKFAGTKIFATGNVDLG